MSLCVSLFGRVLVRLDGRELQRLPSAKAQELLCYLLLYRDRPHARETLAGLLWGESPTFRSKKYLRQALWQVQFALHTSLLPAARRVLLVDGEFVRVNEKANLCLDVAQFEGACALAQRIPPQQLHTDTVRKLEAAVELYQGDLLAGWYQDWCLFERERLQNLFLMLLDKLMDYCESQETYERGLAYGARILRVDRAHECTHQRMMRLRYLAGDRAGALRQYERCVATLKEELGVLPSRHTKALYEQIRADQLNLTSSVPSKGAAFAAPESPSVHRLLRHIKQVRARLAALRQDVLAVERVLQGEIKSTSQGKRSTGTGLSTPRLAGDSLK